MNFGLTTVTGWFYHKKQQDARYVIHLNFDLSEKATH